VTVDQPLPAEPAGSVRRNVGSLADLVNETPVHVDVAGLPICLVRSGSRVYALRDECSHQDVPLSEGEVEGGAIECWLHGSRFDLATGAALGPPATRPVAVYPVWIADDGRIYLSVDA
jgi:3-phenylpropionate/trans-cinnamate dioxygenase ferredoxin subunit